MNNELSQHLFSSRINDLIAALDKRAAVFSHFLDEGELSSALRIVGSARCFCSSFGGYDGAERRVLALSSLKEPRRQDFPVSSLCFDLPVGVGISHKDVLGALMALGIKRDFVGDILFPDGSCVFFVINTVAPLVISDLRSVGRLGVKPREFEGDFAFEREFENVTLTVSSPRADCVISSLIHCSRSAAEQMIASGFVKIGGVVCTKKDRQFSENDSFSIRRYGKYRIGASDGLTKKGKIKLNIIKYV